MSLVTKYIPTWARYRSYIVVSSCNRMIVHVIIRHIIFVAYTLFMLKITRLIINAKKDYEQTLGAVYIMAKLFRQF